jgi:hypothetical protein
MQVKKKQFDPHDITLLPLPLVLGEEFFRTRPQSILLQYVERKD